MFFRMTLCEKQEVTGVIMKKIPKWSIGVLVGMICLVLGAFEDQFMEIYRKAVMICLECIGIG